MPTFISIFIYTQITNCKNFVLRLILDPNISIVNLILELLETLRYYFASQCKCFMMVFCE